MTLEEATYQNENLNNGLFGDRKFVDLERQWVDELLSEIGSISELRLFSKSIDELVQELIEPYVMTVPDLSTERYFDIERRVIFPEDDDAPFGYNEQSGVVATAEIAFTGDETFFQIQPTDSRARRPQGLITSKTITLLYQAVELSEADAAATFAENEDGIRENVDLLRQDAFAFNARLPQLARDRLESRRDFFVEKRAIAARLGFQPKIFQGADVLPIQELEGIIDLRAIDEQYQRILRAIGFFAVTLEKHPADFLTMGEDRMRSHLLATLNSHVEGRATGETKNGAGKVDILVSVDGNNVLVGECKIWHGSRRFSVAVDQALSYMVWRDRRAAVIVFNRNHDTTQVVKEVRKVMGDHPQYRSGPTVEDSHGTVLRYVFAHHEDPNVEIVVTTMVFAVRGFNGQ